MINNFFYKYIVPDGITNLLYIHILLTGGFFFRANLIKKFNITNDLCKFRKLNVPK